VTCLTTLLLKTQ